MVMAKMMNHWIMAQLAHLSLSLSQLLFVITPGIYACIAIAICNNTRVYACIGGGVDLGRERELTCKR